MEKKAIPPGVITDKPELIGVKRMIDSYSNLAANLGLGANNLSETASYVMNRITWDYWTLNVLFRNNWIAKAIIEKPANEMVKNGFTLQTQLEPDKINKIMQTWSRTKTNEKFLDCVKWARLYGGCIMVPLIEGQESLEEPLDLDEVMPGSYKGCFLIDRWSGVSPSISLVDDIDDPDWGEPEYYLITDNTTHETYNIHHSRIIKMIGRKLPYWEETAENYWGASELEHVFAELKKSDDTSANISFLIFLANVRVFKSDGLAQMIAMGDQEANQKVYETMQAMNRLMCNTGTLAMDSGDSFEEHAYTFTGINDVYESFMLDISGAAEIPIDKLFGRSPTGFNSGAETLQNYYDTIQEKQESYIRSPLEKLIKIITMSAIGEVPDDMDIIFNPIRRPADLEKADLAQKQAQPIFDAYSSGLIGKGTALRELKQQSPTVGIWTNITDEMIQKAEEEDERRDSEEKEDREALMEAMLRSGGSKNAEKVDTENQAAQTVDKSNKRSFLRM